MAEEFKNTDIEDVQYKGSEEESYSDVQEMYMDGEGVWARGGGPVPVPVYRRGSIIYEAYNTSSYSFPITVEGYYSFDMCGGGGGSALLSWSNISGTYGGAAVAPGGSGAYLKATAYLYIGDTITMVVGSLGSTVGESYKAINGNFTVTGGNGGHTYVRLNRFVPAKTVVSYASWGRPTTTVIPAHTIDEVFLRVSGGKGGVATVSMSDGGTNQQNRTATGGEGGTIVLAGGAYATANSMINGNQGESSIYFDSEKTNLTTLEAVCPVTPGQTYGFGAGGRAYKRASKSSVSCGTEQINPGTPGAIVVRYQANNINDKRFLNSRGFL